MYMLFHMMELETRKHLSDDLLAEGRRKSLKEKLFLRLTLNMYVGKMWEALQGHKLTNGELD